MAIRFEPSFRIAEVLAEAEKRVPDGPPKARKKYLGGNTKSNTRPWGDEGVSRATWYRRKAKAALT